MSGAKVAVLLLALGKPRAAKVLKRFNSEDSEDPDAARR